MGTRVIIVRTGVQTLRGDGDAAADDNTSAEEVFNVSGDNGLFWCTGGFVCAGGEAPCCTHHTLLFLTD